jgi:hypothetical protein
MLADKKTLLMELKRVERRLHAVEADLTAVERHSKESRARALDKYEQEQRRKRHHGQG